MQIDGNVSLNTIASSGESSLYDYPQQVNKIPVIITNRSSVPSVPKRERYNKTIKRSNKLLDAVHLTVVVNLNPRSIYNKAEEFKTMMDQLDCSLCFMSESWDRDSLGLETVIHMDGFRVIKNVLQRKGKGGKPALIIKESNYFIKELCPDVITVPPGVEAVWALLTPKSGGSKANIRHIAVCSYYYTVKTTRSQFIDHISEAFNILCAKYSPGLEFILAGDTNRLNMKSILNLSPNLKQQVKVPTRMNPDAILDTITSTLSAYYQDPFTLAPLDNDNPNNGKPSDHLIVVWKPINASVPKTKVYKEVSYRPLPESGLLLFGNWLKSQSWDTVSMSETAHEKAKNLQNLLLEGIDNFLPVKNVRIYNQKLKNIDRRQKREYNKHKKSEKWNKLNEIYLEKCAEEKEKYYKNIVEDLKTSQPGMWYSKLKRMSSHNQAQSEMPTVQSFLGIPDQIQGEKIADQFSEISHLYEPLKTEDISLEEITITISLHGAFLCSPKD